MTDAIAKIGDALGSAHDAGQQPEKVRSSKPEANGRHTVEPRTENPERRT
jgi:hypothetical protein